MADTLNYCTCRSPMFENVGRAGCRGVNPGSPDLLKLTEAYGCPGVHANSPIIIGYQTFSKSILTTKKTAPVRNQLASLSGIVMDYIARV